MVKRHSEQPKTLSPIIKNIGRILLAIFFFIGLSMFGLIVFFIQVSPILETKNIVFVSSKKNGNPYPILLASIDGKAQKVFVYQLSSNLKSSVIGGYGEYPLSSVKPLLELEKKDHQYIKSSFSHILKHSVTDVYDYQPAEEDVDKNKLVILLLKKRETWNLAVKLFKLENLSWRFEKIDSWESWGKALDNQLVGEINDLCSVAVVNATTVDGLAGEISQILENSGVDVVRTTDNIWDQPVTAIYQKEDLSLDCKKVLEAVQSVSPVHLPINIDQTKPTQYRAQIVFFIGNELAEILSKGN